MASLLDMSLVPLPAAVDLSDYATLRAEWLALYAAKRGVLVSELDDNDPAVHALEAGAYRELVLRARINDGVRATLLASAWGESLDDMGADPLYGSTPRLLLDPGDPNGAPPIPPVWESDTAYRARLQQAPAALSVAGPAGAYEVLARKAHPDVIDVRVTSPTPAAILVEVLHTSSDAQILTKIGAALRARDVRPAGDRITVVSAAKQTSEINLTIFVPAGPDMEAVRAASEARVREIAYPLCAKVASGATLSASAVAWSWLGSCVVPGVSSWQYASIIGASNNAAAWWPMTINVVASPV